MIGCDTSRYSRPQPENAYYSAVARGVAVRLGEVTARWEAPATLTIAGWIREGGRQAKRWAGDTSKTLRLAGILTDAEENRRLGN